MAAGRLIFGLGAESDRYRTIRDMYLEPVRDAAERWLVPRWRDRAHTVPGTASAPTADEALVQA